MHDHDINLLVEELEEYRQEKEKIRKVIGSIGGKLTGSREKYLNYLFIFLMLLLLAGDIGTHFFHLEIPLPTMLSLELAILLVSIKIIMMMHMLTKIAHFQFWIMNSIEFRLNNLTKTVQEIRSGQLKDE